MNPTKNTLMAACAVLATLAPTLARADVLYDSTGIAIGTAANPLYTTAAANSPTLAPVTAGTATATSSQLVACQYISTLPTFANTNQGPLQCGTRGGLHMELWLQDSTTAIGGRPDNVDGDTPSAISSNLRTVGRCTAFNGTSWDRCRGDVNGQVSQLWAMSGSRWSSAAPASGIVNTTTAVTIKAAAGASVKTYLTSCQIDHDALGGVTELVWRDGASGTVLARKKLQVTAVEGAQVTFASPLAGTANTLMEVATLTAVTGGVYVNCQGFTGS